MEIQNVIDRANQLLTEARYTSSRIYTYNWLWKKGILSYMTAKSLVDFDEKVGKECVLTFHDGSTVTFYHRDLIKSVDVLINVFLNDNLGKSVNRNKKCSDFGKKNYSGNGNSLCSNFGNNSAVTVVLN